MLKAKKSGWLSGRYEITRDDQAMTTFSATGIGRGGDYHLEGGDYRIRSRAISSAYELFAADGSLVAATDRVGRRWTLEVSGKVFQVQPESGGGRKQSLIGPDGASVGSIARTGRGVTASLPGLADEVQVFVIAVTLLRMRRRRGVTRVSAVAGG